MASPGWTLRSLSVADNLRSEGAFRSKADQPEYHELPSKQFRTRVLSWETIGSPCQDRQNVSIVDIATNQHHALQIIFVPLDDHRRGITEPTIDLIKQFGLHPCILKERTQDATYAFGHRQHREGTLTWLRFLCKNIKAPLSATAQQRPQPTDRPTDVEMQQVNGSSTARLVEEGQALHLDASRQSHASFTYIKSTFALRVRNDPTTGSILSVALLCFGASKEFVERMELLKHDGRWQQIMHDPMILLSIVLDELHAQMDSAVWNLGRIFGSMETVSTLCHSPRTRLMHIVHSQRGKSSK